MVVQQYLLLPHTTSASIQNNSGLLTLVFATTILRVKVSNCFRLFFNAHIGDLSSSVRLCEFRAPSFHPSFEPSSFDHIHNHTLSLRLQVSKTVTDICCSIEMSSSESIIDLHLSSIDRTIDRIKFFITPENRFHYFQAMQASHTSIERVAAKYPLPRPATSSCSVSRETLVSEAVIGIPPTANVLIPGL